jgi:hypothetical protein
MLCVRSSSTTIDYCGCCHLQPGFTVSALTVSTEGLLFVVLPGRATAALDPTLSRQVTLLGHLQTCAGSSRGEALGLNCRMVGAAIYEMGVLLHFVYVTLDGSRCGCRRC